MRAFPMACGLRLAAAVLLLAAPAVAQANTGVGYLMVTLPVIVLALLPVIPVEAAILWRLLKLPVRRALYLSFVANLYSTFAGAIISFPFDIGFGTMTGSSGVEFTRVAVSIMLVPMFFITWWVEQRVIVSRLAEWPAPRVRRSAFAANLVSYIAMIAWALLFLPQYSATQSRAYTSEAILGAGSLKAAVQAFWENHKRFPADLKELGEVAASDGRHSAGLAANGRISVRINRPVPDLQGRQVLVWPVVEGDKLIWKCGSPDIEPKYLPSACREPMP